jgi:hypothetical protein
MTASSWTEVAEANRPGTVPQRERERLRSFISLPTCFLYFFFLKKKKEEEEEEEEEKTTLTR